MGNTIYPEFKNEASCASGILDPDIWFDYEVARNGYATRTDNSLLAKRICNDCPALRECRKYALQYDNLWGIWGGLDHTERKRMQVANRIKTIDYMLSYPNATQPLRETGQGNTTRVVYE